MSAPNTSLAIYQLVISFGMPLLILVLGWVGFLFKSMKAEIKKLALEMSWRSGSCEERHKTIDNNYDDHEARLNLHADAIQHHTTEIEVLKTKIK